MKIINKLIATILATVMIFTSLGFYAYADEAQDAQIKRILLSEAQEYDSDEYVAQYRVKPSAYTSDSGDYYGYPLENAFDGDYDTVWQSANAGKTELTVTFGELTSISKIVYKATSTSGGGEGYPKKLTVYYSGADAGDFTSAGTISEASTSMIAANTDEKVIFMLPQSVSAKRIKLVFENAQYDSRARASEIRFLRTDELAEKVENLFTDDERTMLADGVTAEYIATLKSEAASHVLHDYLNTLLERAAKVLDGQRTDFSVCTLQKTGNDNERNILFLVGDGYSAEQQDDFINDCNKSIEALFAYEPYARYRHLFNIYAMKVESNDERYFGSYLSGRKAGMPTAGWKKLEALKKQMENYYLDEGAVITGVAQGFHTAVLVNTSDYGGAQYPDASITNIKQATGYETFVHEVSHGFARLMDEYGGDGGHKEGVNNSGNGTQDTVPWKEYWGFRADKWGYRTIGAVSMSVDEYTWYRPSDSCMMKDQSPLFCSVCQGAIASSVNLGAGDENIPMHSLTPWVRAIRDNAYLGTIYDYRASGVLNIGTISGKAQLEIRTVVSNYTDSERKVKMEFTAYDKSGKALATITGDDEFTIGAGVTTQIAAYTNEINFDETDIYALTAKVIDVQNGTILSTDKTGYNGTNDDYGTVKVSFVLSDKDKNYISDLPNYSSYEIPVIVGNEYKISQPSLKGYYPIGSNIDGDSVSPTSTTDVCEVIYYYSDNVAGCSHENGYSDSDVTVVTAPTCSKDGAGTAVCKICGETVNVTIPATGKHSYTELVSARQEPTCTANGKEAVYKCATCDATTIGAAIPALNHSYAKTTVAPTKTSYGYTQYACTRCGDIYRADFTDPLTATVKAIEPIYADSNGIYTIDGIKDPVRPASTSSAWTGSKVYFGNYSGGSILFRVLDASTTDYSKDGVTQTMFLDSDTVLKETQFDSSNWNTWSTSSLYSYLNEDFYKGFSSAEQSAVAASYKSSTSVTDGYGWYGYVNWCDLIGERVFLLDAKEATSEAYGYSNTEGEAASRAKSGAADGYWWTRSPYVGCPHRVAYVYPAGSISIHFADSREKTIGVSPALNLDLSSVLFASAAENGKPSKEDGSLTAIADSSTSEWKLTIKDSSRSKFTAKAVSNTDGSNEFEYSGAQIGENEYLSAIIKNDKTGKYESYGRLKKLGSASDASGKIKIALPDDMTDKTVLIFNEQYNGDKSTDYSSELIALDFSAVHTHKFDDGKYTVITAPTCVKDGTGTAVCTICGEEIDVTIPATGVHNYTELVSAKQEPTCTEKGKEAVYKCASCDLTTGGEEIPANGHTEVVDAAVAATCMATGLTEGKHCSVCNEVITKQEVIPANGHTEVADAAVTATCTATGLTEGKHCSVCNEVLTAQEVTPALGHDYAKTVVAPTTASQGYTVYTCTRCGDTYKADYTDKLPSTDANTGNNTSSDTGSNTSNTGGNTSTNTTDPTVAPTAEESKIAEQYGVDNATAKQIVAVLKKYGVSEKTAALTEKAMTSTVPKNDGDYSGSSFGLLKAKATNLKKNSITVKWNKVKGADGYIIYGAKCGSKSKYKKIATVSAKKLSYTQKKLKKGTYYKYNVVAYKNVNGVKVTIAASKKIHAITKGGKYGVAKSVKLNKSKVTLKKGKKFQIKASEVKQDKTIKKHRKLCYESSNTKVATVNSKGKITAKKKGKCTIYVYAQNGVYKTVTVTVK